MRGHWGGRGVAGPSGHAVKASARAGHARSEAGPGREHAHLLRQHPAGRGRLTCLRVPVGAGQVRPRCLDAGMAWRLPPPEPALSLWARAPRLRLRSRGHFPG